MQVRYIAKRVTLRFKAPPWQHRAIRRPRLVRPCLCAPSQPRALHLAKERRHLNPSLWSGRTKAAASNGGRASHKSRRQAKMAPTALAIQDGRPKWRAAAHIPSRQQKNGPPDFRRAVEHVVGVTRFELVTSSVSGKRSPPELNARTKTRCWGCSELLLYMTTAARARHYFKSVSPSPHGVDSSP